MAKSKKVPKERKDMTNDELAKLVFPAQVVKELKRIANPKQPASPLRKKSSR